MPEPLPPDTGSQAQAPEDPASPDQGATPAHKDIATNLGAFAVGHVFARLSGLAAVVVIARQLSPADFGRYSVALALSSMLTLLVESGMGGYLVREGTQSPERAGVALGHVTILQLSTGTLAVGMCALVGSVLGYDHETSLATIFLAVGSVALISQRAFLAMLSALNKPRIYAGFQSAQSLFTASATVGAALAGAGPPGIAAALMVSALLTFPVAYWLLDRNWDQRIRFERGALMETFKVAAAYSATRIGSALFTYIDAVMVQAFKGNVAAAQYGASYRLMMAARLLQQVYSDGLAQPAARLAKHDRGQLQEVLTRSMGQLYVMGLAIGVGGFILAEPIMTTVFGAPYADAATTAGLLFLTVPLSFACQPCIIVGLAMGLERRIAMFFGLSVLADVALNLVLIPEYGPSGAAVAMMIAFPILYGLTIRALRGEGIRLRIAARMARTTVAGGAMAVVLLLAAALPLAALILVGAAVYLAVIRALRVLEPADLDMMPMGHRLGWLAAPRAGPAGS